MDVDIVPIDSVHEDPANVREHDDRNLAAIKASLAKWGQQKPIVVGEDGVVIAGNGTLRAARELGWTEIGIVRSELAGADATGYAIADNRSTDLSGFIESDLARALEALKIDANFDELLTGFSTVEIEGLAGRFDVDDAEFPSIPDGDRSPFQKMSFILHDDQAESVKAAVAAAKGAGPFDDSPNENSNGNALARIAEAYLGQG